MMFIPIEGFLNLFEDQLLWVIVLVTSEYHYFCRRFDNEKLIEVIHYFLRILLAVSPNPYPLAL